MGNLFTMAVLLNGMFCIIVLRYPLYQWKSELFLKLIFCPTFRRLRKSRAFKLKGSEFSLFSNPSQEQVLKIFSSMTISVLLDTVSQGAHSVCQGSSGTLRKTCPPAQLPQSSANPEMLLNINSASKLLIFKILFFSQQHLSQIKRLGFQKYYSYCKSPPCISAGQWEYVEQNKGRVMYNKVQSLTLQDTFDMQLHYIRQFS